MKNSKVEHPCIRPMIEQLIGCCKATRGELRGNASLNELGELIGISQERVEESLKYLYEQGILASSNITHTAVSFQFSDQVVGRTRPWILSFQATISFSMPSPVDRTGNEVAPRPELIDGPTYYKTKYTMKLASGEEISGEYFFVIPCPFSYAYPFSNPQIAAHLILKLEEYIRTDNNVLSQNMPLREIYISNSGSDPDRPFAWDVKVHKWDNPIKTILYNPVLLPQIAAVVA